MHIHVATKKFSVQTFFSIFDFHKGFAFNLIFSATVNFRARKKKEKCMCAFDKRKTRWDKEGRASRAKRNFSRFRVFCYHKCGVKDTLNA